ncbi:MAG: BMP family ABC transporter substrate-binding protein [Lachnospiraceae bacterium]|nr:BMP family ABC transporter substrate-binding protein [Lachnospiraceae bacterium]
MDYTYANALHLGERCYKEKAAKGEDPCLPALTKVSEKYGGVSEQALGLQEIPLELIVGTYSEGRSNAFAANFMPLMDLSTEFAGKYQALIAAHVKEGIRDPIKVYEYLHEYYVVEGNKRVSVLKLFNAVSFPGEVTRLLPARSNDPKIQAYYEFVEFYRIAPVNFLNFSNPGDYQHYLDLTGFSADHLPKEDDLRTMKGSFLRFQSAYRAQGGRELKTLTDGDAYLIFLDFYGYRETLDEGPAEIRSGLLKIWDEYILRTKKETEKVELVTAASEENKQNILERIFVPDKFLKIAFVYEKTPETLAWTYGHELGRQYVMQEFSGKIMTKAYMNVTEDTVSSVIAEAAEDGADVVFVTSSRFLDASLKAAVAFPDMKVLCCALNFPHRYLRTYYARTYEAKFISGVIAGSMARSSDIGYVANCPYIANVLNLNAFANGVKMVNPHAKVRVVWTDEIGTDPQVTFWNEGISIISGRDLIAPIDEFHREFGLYRYAEDHQLESLALTLWDWGVIYQKIIESIWNGNWEDVDKKSGRRAVNYFWGMDSGAIDLVIDKNVPDGVVRMARFLLTQVKNGELSPFSGILEAQDENVSKDERKGAILKELMEMGWLLDNVKGHIPSVSELRPEVRQLVELQGIHSIPVNGGTA